MSEIISGAARKIAFTNILRQLEVITMYNYQNY